MVFVKTISITLQIGDTDSATAKLKTPSVTTMPHIQMYLKGLFLKFVAKFIHVLEKSFKCLFDFHKEGHIIPKCI